jgi:ribonuclease-3
VVCNDLDIPKYSMFSVSTKKDLKIKDRADLLEAFIGALYVDKDLVRKIPFGIDSIF